MQAAARHLEEAVVGIRIIVTNCVLRRLDLILSGIAWSNSEVCQDIEATHTCCPGWSQAREHQQSIALLITGRFVRCERSWRRPNRKLLA